MYLIKYKCQCHVCKHLHENLWPHTLLSQIKKRSSSINVSKRFERWIYTRSCSVFTEASYMSLYFLPQGILFICSFLYSFLRSCDWSSFMAPCSTLFMHTSSCLSAWSSQYSRLSSVTSWSLTSAIYIDFSLLDCQELKTACSKSKLFTRVKDCRIRKDKDESQLADSH